MITKDAVNKVICGLMKKCTIITIFVAENARRKE
jgi:hypothetical protein